MCGFYGGGLIIAKVYCFVSVRVRRAILERIQTPVLPVTSPDARPAAVTAG